MSETQNNTLIDFSMIKDVVADVVRETVGIADIQGFLVHTISSKENQDKVIIVRQIEDKKIEINFSIAVQYGHMVLQLPEKLQNKIHNQIKYYFGFESIVNIQVNNVYDIHKKET